MKKMLYIYRPMIIRGGIGLIWPAGAWVHGMYEEEKSKNIIT